MVRVAYSVARVQCSSYVAVNVIKIRFWFTTIKHPERRYVVEGAGLAKLAHWLVPHPSTTLDQDYLKVMFRYRSAQDAHWPQQ